MAAEECIFRVELLPARHGDSIWIEYGSPDAPHIVLIDGGPAAAFANIKRRIERLPRRARPIELVVVSHVDTDHIAGIVRLLGEPTLRSMVRQIWFNGWEQLRRPLFGFSRNDARDEVHSRSPWEGSVLGHRIANAKCVWNAAFGGNAICVARGKDPPEVVLEGGLHITLLSPDVESLKKLRAAWDRALKRVAIDPNDPLSVSTAILRDRRYRTAGSVALSQGLVQDLSSVAGKLDDTVANGSSIAFLAEYAGKRCAFLADSHASVVERSLRRVAECRGEIPLRLDAVKVSHHGSRGNTTPELLRLIDCSRFLISTDGSVFGHPDDEAIAQLVRFGSKPVTLGFNYRSERSKAWDDDDLKCTLQYKTLYATGDEPLVVDLMLPV